MEAERRQSGGSLCADQLLYYTQKAQKQCTTFEKKMWHTAAQSEGKKRQPSSQRHEVRWHMMTITIGATPTIHISLHKLGDALVYNNVTNYQCISCVLGHGHNSLNIRSVYFPNAGPNADWLNSVRAFHSITTGSPALSIDTSQPIKLKKGS